MAGMPRFERFAPWMVCTLVSSMLVLSAALPDVAQSGPAAPLSRTHRWMAAAAAARRADNLLANANVTVRHESIPACYAQAGISGSTVRFSSPPRGSAGAIVLRTGSGHSQAMITQSPACAPKVEVGHSYSASLRYRGTGTALGLEVLERVKGVWRASYVAKQLQGRTTFTTASAVIGPIQAGVGRLAFGVLLRGRGVVHTTGYSLIDVSAHPQASSVPPRSRRSRASSPRRRQPQRGRSLKTLSKIHRRPKSCPRGAKGWRSKKRRPNSRCPKRRQQNLCR